MEKSAKTRGTAIFLMLTVISICMAPAAFSAQAIIKKTSHQGIYITENVAKLPKYFQEIRSAAKSAGLDTLVIDVKHILEKPIRDAAIQKKLLTMETPPQNEWLKVLVEKLHGEGFQVTGRIVVYKDDHLILVRPDLGIRKKSTGNVWLDHQNARWADPYSEEVAHYNYLICMAAALAGVDEIQLDYIRFPTDGNISNIAHRFQDERSHTQVIADFLKKVRGGLDKHYPHVSLAIDVFGVVVWQDRKDIFHLGQELKALAPFLDVVSPMIYPSHFYPGRDGFANPGAHPYHFVHKSTVKAKELLKGFPVKIIPWIQGFDLRSPNFGPEYIREQIRGVKDAGVEDFLIWNARNVYGTAFRALLPSASPPQVEPREK